MKKSNQLVSMADDCRDVAGCNPFDSLPTLTHLEVKLNETAVNLTALMVTSGLNRTAMAEKIGWKKSRLSHVLSGKCNLTLKTINEVATTLGVDFDLVFREPLSPKPRQPWQASIAAHVENAARYFAADIRMVMQTPKEVSLHLLSGVQSGAYLVIQMPEERLPLDRVAEYTEGVGNESLEHSKYLPYISDATLRPVASNSNFIET